jgi:glycogen debranching enzyme
MRINRRSLLRFSLVWPATVPFWSGTLLQAAESKEDRRKETLTKERPATADSLADAIVIKNENVFFVARPDGNVPLMNSHGMGLYYHDCRYVNGYEMELVGMKPAHLSASSAQGSVGIFTLTNPRLELANGNILDEEELGITWRRLIDNETPALRDRLHIQNFTLQTIEFPVTLTIQSTFEDLFAVRGLLPKHLGTLHPPFWEGEVLRFSYGGKDGIVRTVTVYFDPPPDKRRGTMAEFAVRLSPRGQQQIDVALVIGESKDGAADRRPRPDPADFSRLESELERETQSWMAHVTQVVTNGSALDQLMERSFRGLRVLRTHLGNETFFAAGVPWFVTLFGRDSLITAWQMLAYHPRIAEQTLRLLAKYQGTKEDSWRDEQPGKILHELRVGEMANLDAIPHTPFYGTVDATPLFLMLVAEHAAWSGSLNLFNELRAPIERALSWMDTYGDRHGEAYLTYTSRSKDKLVNQGWKDSGDAIVTADGAVAVPPLALVEVQGYGYAAKLGMAELFKRVGDRDRADRLMREPGGCANGSTGIFGWRMKAVTRSPCRRMGGRPRSSPPILARRCGPASPTRTKLSGRSDDSWLRTCSADGVSAPCHQRRAPITPSAITWGRSGRTTIRSWPWDAGVTDTIRRHCESSRGCSTPPTISLRISFRNSFAALVERSMRSRSTIPSRAIRRPGPPARCRFS